MRVRHSWLREYTSSLKFLLSKAEDLKFRVSKIRLA
jgi:hypothetical protein